MNEQVHESAVQAPHPRLRPFVSRYTGYRLDGFAAGIHAGLPSGSLTLIVAFDEPLSTSSWADHDDRTTFWGMLAGLHSSPAAVHHTGRQHGVQLAVTPRGATTLFGVPAGEMADQSIQLEQIAPAFATELIDRLSTARTWRTRWAVLDEILLRVMRIDRELPPELERAWAIMRTTHGSEPVAALAEHAGWSRRHFAKRFRENYGLSPKLMARVLRFERAQQMMRLPTRPSLASVAAACGYADQAHMTREWTEFAGAPPTVWLADEGLPFVQDHDQ